MRLGQSLRCGVALFGLVAASAPAQTLKPTPNAPPVTGVVLQNALYTPSNHTVDYDMVNLTEKYANAWVIVQYFKNSQGDESVGGWGLTEMVGSTTARNTPVAGAAGAPVFGMLAPGERRHGQSVARAGNGVDEVVDMRVNLAAVIYDDASAEGDDAFLNSMFAARKARSDEHQLWMARISALKSSADPLAQAQQLYQDMVEASYQEDKANVGEVTGDQRAGRQERQRIQEAVRGLVKAAEAKRPLEVQIRRMEAEAEAMLAGSVRRS